MTESESPYRPTKLLEMLKAKDFQVVCDEYNTIFVASKYFYIWIMARPAYCDRGRWQLMCETLDASIATVDEADGFPRYYFLDTSLVDELCMWTICRERNIKDRNR